MNTNLRELTELRANSEIEAACPVMGNVKVESLIKDFFVKEKFNNCNWLISRFLSKENKVRFAIFAARQVLPIFERVYSSDNRPRLAIEAAEAWVADPSEINRRNAADAAADAAAAAADAAADAADAATYAAAADAATYAAAADAAADAADAATYAAAAAAATYAAKKEMLIKIINYGLTLFESIIFQCPHCSYKGEPDMLGLCPECAWVLIA